MRIDPELGEVNTEGLDALGGRPQVCSIMIQLLPFTIRVDSGMLIGTGPFDRYAIPRICLIIAARNILKFDQNGLRH